MRLIIVLYDSFFYPGHILRITNKACKNVCVLTKLPFDQNSAKNRNSSVDNYLDLGLAQEITDTRILNTVQCWCASSSLWLATQTGELRQPTRSTGSCTGMLTAQMKLQQTSHQVSGFNGKSKNLTHYKYKVEKELTYSISVKSQK